MKLLSVCVARPQILEPKPEYFVSTAIFKKLVEGRLSVGVLNIQGDAQADLTVHGGRSKAVYAYPSEHYEFWQAEYSDIPLTDSQFGENLSTLGLLETEVCIGDKLSIGTAEFVVTEPRLPCYKLGIRFGRSDILRRFIQSRKSGFYLAVTKTGEIGSGDDIEFISRDENEVTVDDIVRVFAVDKDDRETIERALKIDVLPDGWKQGFLQRLG